MPYHLEHFGDKAIVVNTKTGKHHSLSPIPLVKAQAQERVLEAAAKKEDSDPCWKGYQMIGMKTKRGRKVPNCVPE